MIFNNLKNIPATVWAVLFSLCLFSNGFSQEVPIKSIAEVFEDSENITGKKEYLNSPYVTAGNKLYMVGHQNGTFPDLGWHVKDEMGGIWHHPIKLYDGFKVGLSHNNASYQLDSASAFVNYPFGNKHIFNPSEEISVERYQFVPDDENAVYVEYAIHNKSSEKMMLSLTIDVAVNLRPVWLGEQTGMVDSKDISEFDKNRNLWISKDSLNSWYAVYGSPLKGRPSDTIGVKSNKPNSSITQTEYSIEIAPNSVYSFPIVFAGSSKSKEEAIKTFHEVSADAYVLISEKKDRLEEINKKSEITLSDKELETAMRWIKYNSDWLIVEVEDIGRGITAGFPDYPWWFGVDMEYTLKGLIATGRKDLVYSSIDLIHNFSQETNGNGRIVHEVSTNGAVFNPGNINETPQFASLIWEVFQWTGDKEFLTKYFPTIEMGLQWLLQENDENGNLLPDGFGMMEIHGMDSEMIDVAVYTQKAFADASVMAKILGKETLAGKYDAKAALLKNKINTDFWVEESNSYADFIGTKKQALRLLDDALVRADTLKKPWAVTELKESRKIIEGYEENTSRGYVMYHNWVVNTPMEMGIADREKAIKALNTAQKFTNPFGMFVTGIDRDEFAGEAEESFAALANKKVFTYTGAVMTLPTGVQAIAENNYGRPGQAYALLKKMLRSFSYALPGSMYEVSPDYGMMTQAWNMYAFGVPVIKQFFGINPVAHLKEIVISPLLPEDLKEGTIERVVIGDQEISMSFKQGEKADSFKITQTGNWKIIFSQPSGKYAQWILNNKIIKPTIQGETAHITVLENSMELVLIK